MDRLERGMTFLASVGSTAPFIGLFGTVWGIMNRFPAIAATHEHQPRRGRARHRRGAVRHRASAWSPRFPAVLAYNKFTSDLDRYAERLENFAGEFGAILSRQLEETAAERWRQRSHATGRRRAAAAAALPADGRDQRHAAWSTSCWCC